MELPIPENVKKLWDLWNLRGCIMLSLFLQAFLVFFATFRQRCKNSLLLTLIWAAYLLADWVAAVAIGLITQTQGNNCNRRKGARLFDQDIYAFWASFLLLHLGGPDTITSFALEDNEFWIRHLFGLILQVMAAGYSFYLTLPENKLWPPTLLVFLVGIIKYAERTRAFYLASLDRFGRTALRKPEPGPDYEEVSTNYFSKLLQVPIQGEMTADQMPIIGSTSSHDPYIALNRITLNSSDEMGLLKAAHILFERFKGLIVGFFLTSKDRKSSRDYFLKTDHKCAFRVVEYELSLMFQVLHTKVVVVRQRIGYVLRFISFSSILAATIYYLLVEKQGFRRLEIILTYSLLIGAIVLDTISLIKLIFSDWTLVVLKDGWRWFVPSIILKRRRWSKLVFQYNMINYCLDERPAWLYKFSDLIHSREFLDKMKIMWFSSSYEVKEDEDLEKFIFDYLKNKSTERASNLRDATEACLERGDSALKQSSDFASYIKLKWSISEFQYTESLLLWHIATEICWEENFSGDRKNQKKCKILSDYMFYLLIAQPTMLSPVLGDWHLVFQDTCAEAKRFFKKYSISNHSAALKKMFSVRAKFRPAAVKGTRSKSVFFDACILAHQLQRLGNSQWKIMNQVWVEFMSYAAVNCRPIVHAQQPSRGGELITFTWLLMNHLGLGMQFSEQEERAGMKMVAVK